MITKRYWNSLTQASKEHLLDYFHVRDAARFELANGPYKHDFDYNYAGRVLRDILSCCTLQKNGELKVVQYTRVMVDPKANKK